MNAFTQGFEDQKKRHEASHALETQCGKALAWMNDNASDQFGVWFTHMDDEGSHYRARGEFDGQPCLFELSYGSKAAPEFLQEEALWTLTARHEFAPKSEGTVIAQGHRDMKALLDEAKSVMAQNVMGLKS